MRIPVPLPAGYISICDAGGIAGVSTRAAHQARERGDLKATLWNGWLVTTREDAEAWAARVGSRNGFRRHMPAKSNREEP